MFEAVRIRGLDELIGDLKELQEKYPDRADDLLRKDARQLRKSITENAKALTDVNESHKFSLGKAKSYKISQVQGFGGRRFVELSAIAPHFHLVEHGHVLTDKKGKPKGFVQGRHFMKKATDTHDAEFEKRTEKMVDELLRKGGF